MPIGNNQKVMFVIRRKHVSQKTLARSQYHLILALAKRTPGKGLKKIRVLHIRAHAESVACSGLKEKKRALPGRGNEKSFECHRLYCGCRAVYLLRVPPGFFVRVEHELQLFRADKRSPFLQMLKEVEEKASILSRYFRFGWRPASLADKHYLIP